MTSSYLYGRGLFIWISQIWDFSGYGKSKERVEKDSRVKMESYLNSRFFQTSFLQLKDTFAIEILLNGSWSDLPTLVSGGHHDIIHRPLMCEYS